MACAACLKEKFNNTTGPHSIYALHSIVMQREVQQIITSMSIRVAAPKCIEIFSRLAHFISVDVCHMGPHSEIKICNEFSIVSILPIGQSE